MIIQFPSPYPDELLYSILARYHIRSGNVFWKHTLEDLFGKRTISATALLPSGIGSLVKRLPENTTLTAQVIIEKHTMYPFYTVFLPTEKAQSIYKSMISDDGKGIYMQSGVMASAIPQNEYLKYCSACAKEDVAKYGELYWHRLHQLPGNLICPKHELWLENSTVPITRLNKHAYILPTTSNCDLTKGRKVKEDILQQLKEIIQQSDHLLNGRFENQSFSRFTEFYRHHLNKKGFASFNGRVKQKELTEAVCNFFSEELLKTLYIEVEKTQWIANISRKHRKSFHPYYHLLMLCFLGLDVDELAKETSFENNPFGQPNWPCLNALCPDYMSNIIKDITIRRCEKTKNPIGRFTCCSCGFSYTRKGYAHGEDDCYKYTRVMNLGFLLKQEMQSLLDKGFSYREIGRRLNVDPGTVIKHATPQIKSKEYKASGKEDLVKLNRQKWLELQQENPELSKTEIRNQSPSTYTFLYRNDREWLHHHSPEIRKRKSGNKRVNWGVRDRELYDRVRKAISEINESPGRPKRITVKSIADVIGERALFEQHIDKMPKTKAFINNIRESHKEFRLRRIQYVLKEMREQGEVIKTWKVLRKAGIKSKYYNELKGVIQSEIE